MNADIVELPPCLFETTTTRGHLQVGGGTYIVTDINRFKVCATFRQPEWKVT